MMREHNWVILDGEYEEDVRRLADYLADFEFAILGGQITYSEVRRPDTIIATLISRVAVTRYGPDDYSVTLYLAEGGDKLIQVSVSRELGLRQGANFPALQTEIRISKVRFPHENSAYSLVGK